ncbi:IclR family transcriptional regulator [Lentzea sp. NPDC058450]|uniref:IclR family transcriptional regulator n=1 Tax=Lentzea sp. NPDC058450 TaxID=3346505 RepID=UPI003660924D
MGNNGEGRDPALVQSVDRAVTVLELLARNGEAGITEIAAELGVHKSSASRLVYTLQARELVEQDGERGPFRIGLGMRRFAGAVSGPIDYVRVGGPVCVDLADRLGETVNIAVLDGDVALNVSQARGGSAVAAQNWVGQRTPLHATSSGKVLLAAASDSEQDRLLAGELVACAPRTITDPGRLRRVLRRTAEDGFATCMEELEAGLHAVAVPVFGAGGDVVAAISAAGPAYRLSQTRMPEIVEELRVASRDLSIRMGHAVA